MKIELTNEFHETSAWVCPVPILGGRYHGYHRVSQATARRLRRELCGNRECVCGDDFGARGGHRLSVYNLDTDNSYIVDIGREP